VLGGIDGVACTGHIMCLRGESDPASCNIESTPGVRGYTNLANGVCVPLRDDSDKLLHGGWDAGGASIFERMPIIEACPHGERHTAVLIRSGTFTDVCLVPNANMNDWYALFSSTVGKVTRGEDDQNGNEMFPVTHLPFTALPSTSRRPGSAKETDARRFVGMMHSIFSALQPEECMKIAAIVSARASFGEDVPLTEFSRKLNLRNKDFRVNRKALSTSVDNFLRKEDQITGNRGSSGIFPRWDHILAFTDIAPLY